ncbi:hypothetical protein [Halobacteriovorax sp. ZH2_bin.1]|uniref:hypothetical protein n=1 Tax=unclassified Halobacteriovorax TaxID=2639665 RepID=UPI00371C4374
MKTQSKHLITLLIILLSTSCSSYKLSKTLQGFEVAQQIAILDKNNQLKEELYRDLGIESNEINKSLLKNINKRINRESWNNRLTKHVEKNKKTAEQADILMHEVQSDIATLAIFSKVSNYLNEREAMVIYKQLLQNNKRRLENVKRIRNGAELFGEAYGRLATLAVNHLSDNKKRLLFLRLKNNNYHYQVATTAYITRELTDEEVEKYAELVDGKLKPVADFKKETFNNLMNEIIEETIEASFIGDDRKLKLKNEYLLPAYIK